MYNPVIVYDFCAVAGNLRLPDLKTITSATAYFMTVCTTNANCSVNKYSTVLLLLGTTVPVGYWPKRCTNFFLN